MKTLVQRIPVISVLLSAIVAGLLLPLTHGFPMVAFFFFFIGLSSLIYILRKNRTWFDTLLYVGIVLLSTFLLLRANEVLLLINFFFIIVFGSLLILPMTRDHTLIDVVVSPLYALNTALTGRNIFPYSWDFLKKIQTSSSLLKYIPSVLITIVLLGITIPLLASANPFFNQLVQGSLRFMDISQLLAFVMGDQPVLLIPRIIAFSFLLYVIPRTLTSSIEPGKRNNFSLTFPVNYLLPKATMGVLLLIFFITQTQLYFASPEVLERIGYTNSRLTNEVFFQVTIVAFIVFLLTFLDKGRKLWNSILTYFLIIEAFFLVGIAFKSVIDYSTLWGLTEKRLWGYATMSWLFGALVLFLIHYYKKFSNLRFFQITIAYTIAVLLSVNMANFDYMIAHFSSARTQSGTDYIYLSKRSTDAGYYKETLIQLTRQIENSSSLDSEKLGAAFRLLRNIDTLQKKYATTIPLNSFNFSEYREYQQVKNIDTNSYRIKFSEIENKFTPENK